MSQITSSSPSTSTPLPLALRQSVRCSDVLFRVCKLGWEHGDYLASLAVGAAIIGGAGGGLAALGGYSLWKEFFATRQVVDLSTDLLPPPLAPAASRLPVPPPILDDEPVKTSEQSSQTSTPVTGEPKTSSIREGTPAAQFLRDLDDFLSDVHGRRGTPDALRANYEALMGRSAALLDRARQVLLMDHPRSFYLEATNRLIRAREYLSQFRPVVTTQALEAPAVTPALILPPAKTRRE